MSTEQSTRATRVARFRDDYLNRPWTAQRDREAYVVAFTHLVRNATDALDQGEHDESAAWSAILAAVGYRYRRAF